MYRQEFIVNFEMNSYISQNKTLKKNIYVIPASIAKRFFAFVIDLFIINIFILGPFSSLFDSFSGSSIGFGTTYEKILTSPEMRASLTGALFVISILLVLYFIVLQKKFGQSIGMMVLNIYVVKIPTLSISNRTTSTKKNHRRNFEKTKIDSSSTRLGFFDLLLRNLFAIPFAPFIFLWIIDPLFLFFNRNSQRLMELVSNTLTVELVDYDMTVKRDRGWL